MGSEHSRPHPTQAGHYQQGGQYDPSQHKGTGADGMPVSPNVPPSNMAAAQFAQRAVATNAAYSNLVHPSNQGLAQPGGSHAANTAQAGGRYATQPAAPAPQQQPQHFHHPQQQQQQQRYPADARRPPPGPAAGARAPEQPSTGVPTAAPPAVPGAPPPIEMIGHYVVRASLGKGSFAEVKLGEHELTGEKVALKVITKANLNKGRRNVHLQREIRFLKLLCHPHITMLYEVVETNDYYVLIMEHVTGGELLQYIRNAERHRLSEIESRRLFRQIVSAVSYCHRNSLIHRDIKPENVMLDKNGDVKMIDFGFSREFKPDMQLDSFIGSPHYAAPELLQGIKYSGPEVDLWSLGILLYVMICGRQPFKHPDMKVLYAKITSGRFEYPEHVSPLAKDLIGNLIRVNPKERLTMETLRTHPWLSEGYDGPPPTYMLERGPITKVDEEIFAELLTYGVDPVQGRELLQQNDQTVPNVVTNFYHLLLERRDRMMSHLIDDGLSSSGSSGASVYNSSTDDIMQADSPMDVEPAEPVVAAVQAGHHPAAAAAAAGPQQHMFRQFDTDEMVPLSVVDKNIRRMVRQNSQLMEQNYFQKRFGSESASTAALTGQPPSHLSAPPTNAPGYSR
ncbi:CAMK/CAMKL protein kinase [Fonticula alba]|uniref:CAMK/CAMKL protein kinase n=1 Tax=Fonticula alba TaxID=691883 RepID=A0A058Z1I2_FONAL|nr:CAMK/CAMKL protein kinase [Fonticula alba]KCV67798.1 CAMK/CAMKL protein kinase [Fonticula alba]|eukprot:XP_009497829.1 CAMK/CAMKL protein kinase [Fonticula alba]